MIGILISEGGFELICDEPVGQRRHLDAKTVTTLGEFGKRYGTLVASSNPAAGLLTLGQDLYRFLDGDGGDLTRLIDRAPRPLRFEIAAPTPRPDGATLALLRAPWELLAKDNAFLASDVALSFSPVRRLGRAVPPPPLDHYRLGLTFMAASPRGARELDYEAEETAIMRAVGSAELDLLVEESGNPRELGERLAELPAMQALHLSCHGHNAWPPSAPADERRPILILEDEAGRVLETGAGQLIEALRVKPPRLLFVSACLTAAGGGEQRPTWRGDKKPGETAPGILAQSLAEAMIDGGFPAVLGWDGSVADRAATVFAAVLYDGLAGRLVLADAVAAARRNLLNAPDELVRNDWHLARLWLGPAGGGPLVSGKTRRNLVPNHGEKEFLVKREIPVAAHDMFVGRRRELQTVLREMRDGGRAGVLLHGMGRLGKSSLAARIANRRRDLKPAVVFAHYGAHDVLNAIEDAVQENREARELVREGARRVRENADALADALIDLLSKPCMQEETGTPLLLVIDDLEQILDADPAGRHRVRPSAAPVLRAVLRAFDRTTDSRLVLTSRFPFVLDGLEQRLLEIQLPPLTEVAQHKLELRQTEAATSKGLNDSDLDARRELLLRVPTIARGNPGLQDLIGLKVVLSSAVELASATRVLTEMETWLAQGGLPSDAEMRAFLENLAINSLIEIAGEGERKLLRNMMLFDLPVPLVVASEVALLSGGSLKHLCNLGLMDALEDPVDAHKPAYAVNALAAGRLTPLDAQEQAKLARSFARKLFLAWNAVGRSSRLPPLCSLLITEIGLLAEDGEIVGACAADAVLWQIERNAATAAAIGQAAIRLLEIQGRVIPLRLLTDAARALARNGDGPAADLLLARGAALVSEQQSSGQDGEVVSGMYLMFTSAERLKDRGEHEKAKQLYDQAIKLADEIGSEQAGAVARARIASILVDHDQSEEALRILRQEVLPVFQRLGALREHAVSTGLVADILEKNGDLDGALDIRRKEELPVYRRLQDFHSLGVTLGQIADILIARKDLEEALHLQAERLEINRRIGSADGIASTLWGIARIELIQGKDTEAIPRITEAYDIVCRLGRAAGIAAIGITLGRILAKKEPEKAFMMLRRSAEIYRKLEQEDGASQAEELITDLGLDSAAAGAPR